MELFVSDQALTRAFIFLLYAPVVLISYWKLMPRLSPAARRIASGFLAAQTLVIVVSLEISPSGYFEWWLWHIDKEWNIPNILASTQLALVGGGALTTAWLTRARSAWQCLYLLGVGLVFLYLGMDEFAAWKDFMENWMVLYIPAGAAITAATIMLAIRSAKHTRIWHLCLLMGLALAAMGGFVIDVLGTCDEYLRLLHIDVCPRPYFLEEGLEFLGIWLALAAMLGHFSEVSPAVRVQRFLYALPALWILLLSQSAAILPFKLHFITSSPIKRTTVEFESLHLRGFIIEQRKGYIRLYLSPKQRDFNELSYSIHLVDKVSGESVSQPLRVSRSSRVAYWIFGTRAPAHRQRMKIEIPPQTPTAQYWIVLTVWREERGEFVREKVLASDRQLLDDTQVILDEMKLK